MNSNWKWLRDLSLLSHTNLIDTMILWNANDDFKTYNDLPSDTQIPHNTIWQIARRWLANKTLNQVIYSSHVSFTR